MLTNMFYLVVQALLLLTIAAEFRFPDITSKAHHMNGLKHCTIMYDDVSYLTLEMIRFGWSPLDCYILGVILSKLKRPNQGFMGNDNALESAACQQSVTQQALIFIFTERVFLYYMNNGMKW